MMVLSNETRLGIQITGKEMANVLFVIFILFQLSRFRTGGVHIYYTWSYMFFK